MNEELEPLSAAQKRVLELAGAVEPPSGAESRVFQALQVSIAAAPVVVASAGASVAAAKSAGLLAVKSVMGIASVVLATGVGVGIALGRTVFAPPAPAPVVVERVVRVEVPVPAESSRPVEKVEIAAAPKADTVPPNRKPAPDGVVEPAKPPAPDELLARERELIDTARSALLHHDASAALKALQAHAATFTRARLDEERESLWVQALVMKGAAAEARAKAAQFHKDFPRSLLGPTVDAALTDL